MRRLYNARGYLASVDDGTGATVYWQAGTVDADGQVTAETLGNGVVTTRAYNPNNGLVDTIDSVKGATTIQDLAFAFDYLGNLTSRGDLRQDRAETFTYDALNRLTGAVLTDTSTSTQLNASTYAYDSILGSCPRTNIASKSDVGAYTYGQNGAGPHAVTTAGSNTYTYDGNGNMTAGAGRTITWTSSNLPALIHDTPSGNETAFTYGPGRERIEQRTLRGGLTTTVTYIDSVYEKRARLGEADELVHYIRAGATVAIFTEIDDGLALTDKTRYLHKDHLGSIEAISDEAGAVTEYLSYDPHGKRRLADWQPGTPTGAGAETPRGFTGHEMLDGVGLIHMNGRVYDPTLGRFISADPVIQYPLTTQGFNRYTYVNNNPLSFTDPSGFGFFSKIKKFFQKYPVLAVVVGVATAWAAGGFTLAGLLSLKGAIIAGATAGFLTGGVKGAFFGAAAAAAFAIGSIDFGLGGFNFLAAAPAHAAAQGAIAGASGADFRGAALSAGFASLAGPLVNNIKAGSATAGLVARTIVSAVIGGTASVIGGGKFQNGAATAAFVRLFNDEHGLLRRDTDKGRPLTDSEVKLAKGVYGDSVNYGRVRIVQGKFNPFQDDNTAMAPNGNIYFPDRIYVDDFGRASPSGQGLFIHEMAHVYQYQTNPLGFQIQAGLEHIRGAEYNYRLESGKPFGSYGIEQQAEIARNYFLSLQGGPNMRTLMYERVVPF